MDSESATMGSKTETKRIADNVEVTSIELFRWMQSIHMTLVRMCRQTKQTNRTNHC